MAPVHHHRQLDAAGAAAGEHGLNGGPGGAAGVEHIIHQHHILIGHVKGQLGLSHNRILRQFGKIIPVEADIDAAAGKRHILDLLDILPDDAGDGLAPAEDAHQHQVFHALVPLGDLVGDAHQRPPQGSFVHDLGLQFHANPSFAIGAGKKMPCLFPARHTQLRMRRAAPFPMSDFAGLSVPKLKNLLFVWIIVDAWANCKGFFSFWMLV